jgi:gamma-glutamylcyclotransferase (GGCT)/AIG2-like uncharacterized protein YtfP
VHPGAIRTCQTAPVPDTPAVLAVYGTLRRGERNAELLAGTRFLGLGRIAGRLHEMPRSAERAYAYPSLVLDGAPGEVVVELYAIPDAATLALADELEAFDPADETGSEYVRRAGEWLARLDWQPLAFAVMSNHIHWVFFAGATPVAKVLHAFHGGFARWLNRSQATSGPVFDGGPGQVLVPDEHCARLIAYVHNNPVRARIVGHGPLVERGQW